MWLTLYQLTRRRPAVTFAVAQFVLLFAFFFPYLTGRLHFVYRDITSYFEPFARYFAASIAEGRFPLWNPLSYAGMPQIAVGHPHPLYPFTWLLVDPAFSRALAVYLFAHLFIAGLCSFQLARALGYRNTTATVCGFAVAWNGYMLGMFSNFQLMSAVTWLPALLLALEKIAGGFGALNLARLLGVSGAVYLLVAAGSPEVSVPAFGLATLWVGIRCWQFGWKGPGGRQVLLRLTGLAAGVLLAAPIILPAMEWLPYSLRRKGLPDWMVLAWSTDWLNWISVLCSHPLGGEGEALRLFFRITRGDDGHSYYLDSPYLSPVMISLAIWGVFAKGWRGKRVLLALLAFMAVVASGAHTPLGPILFHALPGASIVRYPVKLVIFVLGGLIFLAANGLDSLCRRQFSRWALGANLLLGAGCFGAGYALSLNYERVWPWLRPTFASGAPIPAKLIVYVNGLIAVNLFFAGVMILGFVLLVVLYKTLRVRAYIFVLGILGLVAGPLLMSAFVFERDGSTQRSFARESVVARYVAQPRSGFERLHHRFLVPRSHDSFIVPADVLANLGKAAGPGTRYATAIGLHNTPMAYGIAGARGYEGAAINDYLVLLEGAAARSGILAGIRPSGERNDRVLARFAAITSSKILMESEAARTAPPVLDERLFRVVMHDPDLNARLYETAAIRPRWYLTHEVACLENAEEFLSHFLDVNPNAMDGKSRLSFVVRSEAGIAPAAVCGLRGSTGAIDGDRVELRSDRTENLEWRVQSVQDALFVLADQFYEGWEAMVDGNRVPIVRTNLINRGIWLPPGDHIVRMDYCPQSLRGGMWIAGTTLLAMLSLMIVSCFRGLAARD